MLGSFQYQNYLEMKLVTFLSHCGAIIKMKAWILSFLSRLILKISALQFNWFIKAIYTKVSHHKRYKSRNTGKNKQNKTPAKTVCGKLELKTKTQPHLNFRNLHAETKFPRKFGNDGSVNISETSQVFVLLPRNRNWRIAGCKKSLSTKQLI